MPVKQTLKSRIQYRIKRSAVPVFVPKDFLDLSDSDQVGRVLRDMTKNGFLIKIGQGVYTRSKISQLSGKPTLEKPLRNLAIAALKKIGIEAAPSSFDKAYSEGKSTQIPTGRVIGIKGRINRKIGYAGKYITYEQISGR